MSEQLKYRLPRDFVTQVWLPALRSGDYKQGVGELLVLKQTDNLHETTEEYAQRIAASDEYCCLGVAAIACGIPKDLIAGRCFVEELGHHTELHKQALTRGYPRELISSHNSGLNDIVIEGKLIFGQLSSMNDSGAYSFEEIADWIEKEVELYD